MSCPLIGTAAFYAFGNGRQNKEVPVAPARSINVIQQSQPVVEGAGVRLRRAFGFSNETLFDPFLLLDDFRSHDPQDYLKGFPDHPHRGIETITYLLAGDVEHRDSLGNNDTISAGDVQWMTAGSGIIHQEMPKGDDQGTLLGFQLWANLPAAMKMTAPHYRDICADLIPLVIMENRSVVKVIAGDFAGATGPIDDITIDPHYFDCTVPADVLFTAPAPASHTLILYIIDGSGSIDRQPVHNHDLILCGTGDFLQLHAGSTGIRFLFISGKPLREPIAWRGPIVMNTRQELDRAFEEYQNGTFIKHQ